MYKLLQTRRSIRKYKPEKVDRAVVDLLLKSILHAPAGNNLNPWELIYVDEPSLLDQLSMSKKAGGRLIANAPQCLVILADEKKTDVWIEDAAIATTIAHLAATDYGLGSCWVQIRNRFTADDLSSEDFVRNLLAIPAHMRVEAILAFGYPDEEKPPRPENKLQLEKVHANGFGHAYFK